MRGIYKLSKKNYEVLKLLINNSVEIARLYRKLYELESNGLNNSDEFNKTLYDLKRARNKEECDYYDLAKSPDRCSALYRQLIKNHNINSYIIKPEQPRIERTDEIIYNRIATLLMLNLLSDEKFSKKILKTKFIGGLGYISGVYNYIKYKECSLAIAQYHLVSKKDILRSYISILQEHGVDKRYSAYRGELTEIKYYEAFVTPTVERMLINSHFKAPSSVDLESLLISHQFGINSPMCLEFLNEDGRDIAYPIMLELLGLSNFELISRDEMLTALQKQSLMRAGLLFLNGETIKDLNLEFSAIIKSEKYQLKNNIGKDLVFGAFNSIDKDREKHKFLTPVR